MKPFLSGKGGKAQPPLRIKFAIRPEVDRFFAERIRNPKVKIKKHDEIVDALATIESLIKEQKSGIDFDAFTHFIWDKVKLVLTRAPSHTNLKRLLNCTIMRQAGRIGKI